MPTVETVREHTHHVGHADLADRGVPLVRHRQLDRVELVAVDRRQAREAAVDLQALRLGVAEELARGAVRWHGDRRVDGGGILKGDEQTVVLPSNFDGLLLLYVVTIKKEVL